MVGRGAIVSQFLPKTDFFKLFYKNSDKKSAFYEKFSKKVLYLQPIVLFVFFLC